MVHLGSTHLNCTFSGTIISNSGMMRKDLNCGIHLLERTKKILQGNKKAILVYGISTPESLIGDPGNLYGFLS